MNVWDVIEELTKTLEELAELLYIEPKPEYDARETILMKSINTPRTSCPRRGKQHCGMRMHTCATGK